MTDAPKPQPDKFRDMARELECDENAAKFDETVRQIMRAAGKRDAAAPKHDPKP